MITTIAEAAINFCSHQLRQECQITNQDCSGSLFTASIDITVAKQVNTVYIAIDPLLLQDICNLFFGEEQSEQETLIDMLLETTNMIVGSAKTILHEQNEKAQYTLSTPTFLQKGPLNYICDQKICLTTDSSYMQIAYKEQK